MKSLVFFLFFYVFGFVWASAQYHNAGQDPASVRWRQINTNKFKLIYPQEFESYAQRFMNVMDSVQARVRFQQSPQIPKIPIIFHNRTVEPNAFAMWAPKRSDFFTCPPQDSYAQDWLEQLAIHEYRHIAQMSQLNQGFTKFMYYLFGEHAVGAFTGLYTPLWFMEGDAVCAETALSQSGRGRVPNFEQEIRAQILEKGNYSYDKAIFGSYKDFVPNHYMIGYQIVANTKKKYGNHVWTEALNEIARKPFAITPFNNGLKKATGKGKVVLYKEAVSDLGNLWNMQKEKTQRTDCHIVSKEKKAHTRYLFPQFVTDSLFIAERSSMDDIAHFVTIDSHGNEAVIETPGFFSTNIFSTANGKIVWAEKTLDPRWQQRSYSVLKTYDFITKKITQITRHTRLFAPNLSPSGTQIVAVKVTEQNQSLLEVIDAQSGKKLATCFTAKPDEFLMTPSWNANGTQIVFTLLSQKGKSICLLNLQTKQLETILDPTFVEIANPSFADNDHVLFNGSFSGIENIYAIHLPSREVYQVTSSVFGASNADFNPQSKQLVYSDYTSNGQRVASCQFTPNLWNPLEQVTDYSASLHKSLAANENYWVLDSLRIGKKVYESKPYRKFSHLFHFHSWAPAYLNYENEEYNAGISAMSQNSLSTSTLIAGYHWISDERTGVFRANWEYAGWYPVLNLDARYGKRASYDYFTDGTNSRYTWDETQLSGGVKIPLLFTLGEYYINIQPETYFSWENRKNNQSLNPQKFEGDLASMNYRLYTARYIKQSQKDLFPRWGQIIDLNYAHAPFGDIDFGNVSSAELTLYFPSFWKHHGIKMYSGIQQINSGLGYYYNSIVNFPRGIAPLRTQKLLSIGSNYKFPFWYPDGSMGSLAYFKRLKANLFYDFAQADSQLQLHSYGLELTTDVHLVRFVLPFDIGFRLGSANYPKQIFFVDFLFSMNFQF